MLVAFVKLLDLQFFKLCGESIDGYTLNKEEEILCKKLQKKSKKRDNDSKSITVCQNLYFVCVVVFLKIFGQTYHDKILVMFFSKLHCFGKSSKT